MLGPAVALGGEQTASGRAGHGALHQVHVGFLAGLDYAELGIDGGEVSHQPRRIWRRAALSNIPGRPPATGNRSVVGCCWGCCWSGSAPACYRTVVGVVDVIAEAEPPPLRAGVTNVAAPNGQPVVLRHGRISWVVAPPESAGRAVGGQDLNTRDLADSHVWPPPPESQVPSRVAGHCWCASAALLATRVSSNRISRLQWCSPSCPGRHCKWG